MLGEIKFLTGNNGIKSIINNHFVTNELFDFLDKLIEIRNEHAHIKAMDIDKFKELYNLFFNGDYNIKKLLDMKIYIKNKIDTSY